MLGWTLHTRHRKGSSLSSSASPNLGLAKAFAAAGKRAIASQKGTAAIGERLSAFAESPPASAVDFSTCACEGFLAMIAEGGNEDAAMHAIHALLIYRETGSRAKLTPDIGRQLAKLAKESPPNEGKIRQWFSDHC
jgi:mevalonate kinase